MVIWLGDVMEDFWAGGVTQVAVTFHRERNGKYSEEKYVNPKMDVVLDILEYAEIISLGQRRALARYLRALERLDECPHGSIAIQYLST